MKPISYTRLNHPIAQLDAASEFCAQIESHVSDEWYEHLQKKYGEPPDVDEVHPHNVLDALASIGLRFEVAGALDEDLDVGDGYFKGKYQGTARDVVLHSLALKATNGLREFFENDTDDGADVRVVWYLVTTACGWEDLIFVPDTDGVVSTAYQMLCKERFDPDVVDDD